MKPAPLLALSLLALAGCTKPKESSAHAREAKKAAHEINGQVFVVQNDRQNVKLGGIEIAYVPIEAFEKHCDWVIRNRAKASYLKSYRMRLVEIDGILERFEEKESIPGLEDFLNDAAKAQSMAWGKVNDEPLFEEFKEIQFIREAHEEVHGSERFKGDDEEVWGLIATFHHWLPSAKTLHTETDADGNYTLEIPGKGVVFAHGGRRLSDDDHEVYHWAEVVDGTEKTPLHMSSIRKKSAKEFHKLVKKYTSVKLTKPADEITSLKLENLSWFGEALPLLGSLSENQKRIDFLRTKVEDVTIELQDMAEEHQ